MSCRTTLRALRRLAAQVVDADPRFIVTMPDSNVALTGVRARILARERARVLSVGAGAPWRWGMSAALVPIVILVAFVHPPAVLSADELLAHAAAAEREAGADIQDVAIEVTRVGFGDRPLAATTISPGSHTLSGVLLPTVPPAARTSVVRLLAAAPLDVARVALSARTYQAWRATIPRRHDVVSVTREGRLLLRTEMQEPRRVGELLLEPVSYRVIRLTYISDGLRVDVREQAYRPAPRRAAVTLTVTALDPAVLDRAELDARLALRQAQAGLGSGTRIVRTTERVRIIGLVTPIQRAQVTRRLAGLPHLQVELDTASRAAAVVPTPGLARWQARVPGDTEFVLAFAQRAASIAERVAALKELAGRYSPSETSRLTPEARRLVERLATLHYRDLVADLRDIRESIGLLVGLGSRPRPLTSGDLSLPSDWRARSLAATASVRAFSADVDTLLRQEDLPAPGDTDLTRSYNALCDTLLAPSQP